MFTHDDNGPQMLSHSKNWFNRGRELLEDSRYEDALVCFEEAKRLGYPKSAEAILLCQRGLGSA
jgi:hypothetical protein